jgi:hypothetical protein
MNIRASVFRLDSSGVGARLAVSTVKSWARVPHGYGEIMHKKSYKVYVLSCLLFPALPPAVAAPTHTYQWGKLPMGGGFVSAIVPSKTEPDRVYARTDVDGACRRNEAGRPGYLRGSRP